MTSRLRLVSPSQTPQSLVPKNLSFKGGTIEGSAGVLIDGKLQNTTIRVDDQSTIHISALAELSNCTIIGHDLLIEGVFEGKATLTGNCEVAPSATAIGKVELAGDFFKSRFADAVDLHIAHVKIVASQDADHAYDGSVPQAA